MSDPTAPASSGSSKTTIILLGVVALLLVVIIAIVVAMQQNKQTTTSTDATGTSATSSTESTASSMPGVGSSTGAFDPATATKVPAGEKPEAYVSRYYQAILDKEWETAFKMQPAASQTGSVQDFQNTQEQMYGMKAFKIASATEQGDTATVQVEQDLGDNGTWGTTWTFAKSGDDWVVESRKVQMK